MQRLPTEIFDWGSLFLMFTFKKKKKGISQRLVFKFKEIKFCTLFMNWLTWEKFLPIFIINLGL